MPHCSSEEEEQFGIMVGGAAFSASQPLPDDREMFLNDETPVKTAMNNTNLRGVTLDNDFKDTLDKIRSFQIEFPQDRVVQGCGDESLCVFTDRWVSLNEFNKVYRPAQKDKVDEKELVKLVNKMEKKISPGEVQISIRNILASIILQSPNEESLKLNKTFQKCAIITRASVAALDITASIVAQISKHFEVEVLQGLLKNMVDKWKASVKIIINKLRELNVGELVLGTTKNIIQLLIQTKLIGVAYQLAHYLTCNNTHIRIFAGYAMILLLLRCLKEVIKQATPSDENIQQLKTTMDEFVSSSNEDIKSILNDLNRNLPASQIKQKIQELRTSIEKGKTGNLVSDAYIDAAVNACTALEGPLNEMNAVSKSAVDPKELENIKSMLMKITTGWNEINELPSSGAETENNPEKLYAQANELKQLAEQIEAGGGGGGASPEELRAQAEELLAQAEELIAEQQKSRTKKRPPEKKTPLANETPQRPTKRTKTKRGGAPKKHTKKVKSKMLKGKSKKHLKKAKKSKKGKKTGKKVRFHPSSKKSKKNTRKRR
uniref:Uncharacterized protein n=1 Tax=viral metagenome TaxID=1070528 RepID=A0A6C0L1L5_9ZZZZ